MIRGATVERKPRNQVRMGEASEPGATGRKADVDLGGRALSVSFSRVGQGTLRRLWRRSAQHPSIMVCLVWEQRTKASSGSVEPKSCWRWETAAFS